MVRGKKRTIRYFQLYQLDVSDSASVTIVCTYSIYKKLLRMDRYGPKHVELTPEY